MCARLKTAWVAEMCSQDKPLLERLGVRPEVRSFFKPYLIDTHENVIFKHGNSIEHVSQNFHRVPASEETWTAGEIAIARHIFICGSAMDAVAWLHFHHYAYRLDSLFFVAVGAGPSKTQIENFILPGRQYHLVFSNDHLGAVCDLKVASWLRGTPLKIIADDGWFNIAFKNRHYKLETLSLNALEKAVRFHFNTPTQKPKQFNTYFEQLKHGHTN